MASAEGEVRLNPPRDPAPPRDYFEEPVGEVLRGSLRSLPRLIGQFNLEEDVVKININWEKFRGMSLPQPKLLLNALQQHISYLQLFVEKLQPLIKEETTTPIYNFSKTEHGHFKSISDAKDKDLQKEMKHTASDSANLKEAPFGFDPEVVQIKAGKAEIERRISAFIERKQAEINENNVREFCNVMDCNQVSRVVNTYGPQTRNEDAQVSNHNASHSHDCGNQAIEERLQNIEAHLRLQTGGPVPKDIYQRIKKLEDKILELEGMSPEYFQSVNLSMKKRKIQQNQNYSLAELDEKINALKQTLLRKTNEGRPKVVDLIEGNEIDPKMSLKD
ncbi:MAP3K12-binding inhibitory protein 1 isoform X3 [Thamnophis elegans]|uniref:MAP3K12-binding inhibitory protein 1 isoform X3 n=1 Tax=Thamnophis elegans TaxID=35005 RepID=UPI001376C148|nr:MAP3K12-binding inhibitory protein 1 isoform X3 [Thamnophis elegans]